MIAPGRRSKCSRTSSSIALERDDVSVPKQSTSTLRRMRDADRVGDLELAAVGEAGGDDVLRDVARGVRGRAVDLGRVLARERAAAVRRSAAVGVDDDLAAGEPGVAHRPADHELAGRVDVDEVARRRGGARRRGRAAGSAAGRARSMSGLISVSASSPSRCCVEIEHALDLDGPLAAVLVDLVAHRHLRLPVGAQVRQHVGLAHLREPLARAGARA